MTIYYCDFNGGNDTNNGTSFALRKKTLSSFTALSPGDTVRVMGTVATSLTGITCTVNTGDTYMTITSCGADMWLEGVWTSIDASCTKSTETTDYKEGSTSQKFTLVNPPTNTPVAVFNFSSSLNLSAYNAFTAQLKCDTLIGSNIAANIEVGTVANGGGLNSTSALSYASIAPNVWKVVTTATSALSSAELSLALVSAAHPFTGTVNIWVDAIEASTLIAYGGLVGINDGIWYPIRALTGGTTLYFDKDPNSELSTGAGQGWYQANQSGAQLYSLGATLNMKGLTSGSTETYAGGSGTASQPITISGGWDSTAMTTQSGVTHIQSNGSSGMTGLTCGAFAFITLDHFVFSRFATGIDASNASATNWLFTNCCLVGCTTPVAFAGTIQNGMDMTGSYVTGAPSAFTWPSSRSTSSTGVASLIKKLIRTLAATSTGVAALVTNLIHAVALLASSTGVAALIKKVGAIRLATSTGVAALIKFVSVNKLASSTGVASLIKQVGAVRSASSTGVASLIKHVSIIRLASSTGTASLIKTIARTLLVASTGVASLSKGFLYSWTYLAVSTGTAKLIKQVGVVRLASSTSVASLVKQVAVIKVAVSTGSATLIKLVLLTRLAVSTGVASLAKTHVYNRTLAAVSTGAASLVKQIGAVRLASSTGTASLIKLVGVTKLAVSTGTAIVFKQFYKTLIAVSTGIPSIVAHVLKAVLAVVIDRRYLILPESSISVVSVSKTVTTIQLASEVNTIIL